MAKKKLRRRREGVDVEALALGGAHVLEPVGDGEGQLLGGRRPGLLHVVARDRDRVEPGHVAGRVADDVGHDAHARFGRVDVGVADHELLEDVVLDGSAELGLVDALLLAGHDEHGQHGDDRAVHGHRHRHLVEGDAVEQDLHVLDRVDGDPGLAHVALDAGMVAVVAAVGGQVEGHREAHLARGQVAAVEGVGLLGGREPGVLADRPRPVGVHRGAHAAHERGEAGQGVDLGRVDGGHVLGRVEGLDVDALGCGPRQAVGVGALELGGHQVSPLFDGGSRRVAHRTSLRGEPRRPENGPSRLPPPIPAADRHLAGGHLPPRRDGPGMRPH